MSKLLITGVPTGQEHGVDGSPRIEITTFVQDEKQFSLYVQALSMDVHGRIEVCILTASF